MSTLATVWKGNIEVCFVHQQLFQRHSGNLFRGRSGGVPAIGLNTHWNNLVRTICLCFFRQSNSLWTPNKWSTTPVITRPMFGWVGWGCGWRRPRGWAVPAAHWWLSGNVKLGLIWGSVVHCDVFVLVCCAFCMLGNVHLMFLEVLDTHLVKVQGGGVLFLATAQLTERPTEPSLSRH